MKPRVNIYGFPHKGIRYGLGQLSFKVGSLIFDDSEALKACKEIAGDLSELLDLHLHSEEDFFSHEGRIKNNPGRQCLLGQCLRANYDQSLVAQVIGI